MFGVEILDVTNSKIPSELLVLSDAYNRAISNANRAWLAAATLTLVAIGSNLDSENSSVFGVGLTGYNFFAALTIALSVINLRLCSVHTNLYEAQWVLHRYLRDINAQSTYISKSVTIKDVAHRLSGSAYNRIYPILFSVREDVRERIMNKIKAPFDAFYLCTPLIGMIIALARCFSASSSEDLDFSGNFLIGCAAVFVSIQFFVSITTLIFALGVRKRLSNELELK